MYSTLPGSWELGGSKYSTFLLLRRNRAELAEHKVELSWAARFDSCGTLYRSSKDNGGMTESFARVEAGESSSPARSASATYQKYFSAYCSWPSSPVSISIRTTLGVALANRLGELDVREDFMMPGCVAHHRLSAPEDAIFWIRLAMRRSFAPMFCDLRDEHHACPGCL